MEQNQVVVSILSANVETNVESVVKDISVLIKGDITPAVIVDLCMAAMQCVEQIPRLSGIEKKALVVQALTTILKNNGVDPGVLVLVPPFIDLIISVVNGEAKLVEDVKSCWAEIVSKCKKN